MNYCVGMDVSTLIDLGSEGAKFFDEGKEGELLSILKANGVNSIRVRLWRDPHDENGESYGAGTCDLSHALKLGKRIKEAGMHFLLDIHYSDFWCDPNRQIPPKAWQNYSFDQILTAVDAYSEAVLTAFKLNDCMPDMIQVGNEITNGILWDYGKLTCQEDGTCTGYDDLCTILKSAIKGIKKVTDCPLCIHLERSFDNFRYREYFDNLVSHNVPFDSIGISYYPYYHHGYDEMIANISDMADRYDKDIYVVETSYAFTTKHFDGPGKDLVISEGFRPDGYELPYPLTPEGQTLFVEELLDRLVQVKKFKGIYYWEPAWIPTPKGTWASYGARVYMNETCKEGGNEWANQCLFDYEGNSLPALKVFREFNEKYNG